MNRIYRLVWSRATQSLIVVAENTRSTGKGVTTSQCGPVGAVPRIAKSLTVRRLCLALAVAYTGAVQAQPQGGQVAAGTGTITQSTSSTVIQQSSQNMAINWQSFGVAAGQSVHFDQPSASAIVLNRVLGQDPSQILGSLSANGQVFISNPNGVLFGAGAQVNVGGLVATTNSISDADFMAGNFRFANGGTNGSVVNQGTLTAADGGYIALLAPEVRNEGLISARLGTALLAAGNQVTLNLNNGSLIGYNIDQGAVKALAESKHLIQADGGRVFLSAKAADALSTAVVNNTGVIEARTFENRNGTIVLLGDMAHGEVQVGGTLDASAPDGGNGGFIETSAAKVSIADNVRVTTLASTGATGTWLIDPTDFTIAAGTAAQTTSGIGATTLSTALGTSNVAIATDAAGVQNGDIHVNSAVSWSANKLTLTAHGNININANLNGSGTAQLALEYGQSTAAGTGSGYFLNNGAKVNLPAGANFSTRQGSGGATLGYTVITALGAQGSTSMPDLQGINGGLGGRYVLGADIDASATAGWNSGMGFAPLGGSGNPFTGTFDGLGHTVNSLVINRPSSDYVALFGVVGDGSVVKNIGLTGGYVTGRNRVGGLAGESFGGTISNAYNTGDVNGSSAGSAHGGLVGLNFGIMNNVYNTGTVNGGNLVGGLAGANLLTISNAYSTGAVSGASEVGGLTGSNQNAGSIRNAYTTGSTTGSGYYTGGLVGTNTGSISNAYAAGSTTGTSNAGGLVGMHASGHIENVYATGNVTAVSTAGGLVGYSTSSISNAYASGKVESMDGNAGGLVGLDWGASITNSYWDVTTTGQTTSYGSPGSAGLTTIELMQQASYTGFDFTNTWWMSEGNTRPFLRSEYSTTISNAHQLQLVAMNLNANYTLANNIDMGELSRASGMWNTARGFAPLGALAAGFNGIFDGASHTISGLVIYRPTTDYVGLFGVVGSPGTIRNVGLVGGNVTGRSYTGALAGRNNGHVSNTYATSNVAGHRNYTGGLIGYNNGTLVYTYATGNVTQIPGYRYTGGLVGINTGNIAHSYASGVVTSGINSGGLFGLNSVYAGGYVTDSYALQSLGTVDGGLDFNSRAITTAELMSADTFIGWDLATEGGSSAIWRIYEGQSGPLLRSFLTPVTLADTNVTYDGTTQAGAAVPTSGTATGTAASGLNAGTYAAFSDQQGYDITGGTLTIAARALTVTAVGANKVYDGTTAATATFSDNRIAGDDVTLSGTAAFTDKNAGAGKTVNVSGISVAGADAVNYTFNTTALTTADITQRALTVSAAAADKIYDGTTAATASLADDRIAGDALTLASTDAAFADKNAGTGKAVTVSGISVAGADAANYTFNTSAVTTADITQRALSVSATAADKVYDGTTVATATFGDDRIAGDTLAIAGTAIFDDRNVGFGKTVTITGINATGTDAANYTFNTTAAPTAAITPKALTVTANDASRNFDGLPYSGGNGVTITGLVGGDTDAVLNGMVTYGGSAQGAVNPGRFTITPGGLAATNYAITHVDGTLVIMPTGGAPGIPFADQDRAGAALVHAHDPESFQEVVSQARQNAIFSARQTRRGGTSAPNEPAGVSAEDGRRGGSPVDVINGGMKLPQGVN